MESGFSSNPTIILTLASQAVISIVIISATCFGLYFLFKGLRKRKRSAYIVLAILAVLLIIGYIYLGMYASGWTY